MDNNGFTQTEVDFLSLQQSALQNTTRDGVVVSPTSLNWDDSQYSDDTLFLTTASQESFSSSGTATNTPGINTPGINTPENFCFWDSPLNRDNVDSTIRYSGPAGGSHERWMHQMSLLAVPGYLETQFSHSPRITSLGERTPRILSGLAFHKNSGEPSRNYHMGPSKIEHLGNDCNSTINASTSPTQHISISVSRNHKRKSACIAVKPDEHRPVKKTAHNMIEKRYRNKLNDSIAELRDNIPSLRLGGSGMDRDGDPLPKLYKATVITKAVEHISALEKEISRLVNEVEHLRSRVEGQAPGGEKIPPHSTLP